MATEITIHILVPIIVGFIIGIVEAYFVYEDENMTSGKDFLGDMWHGLIFSIFGVLAASNIPWIMSQNWFPEFLKGFMMVDENTGISLIACIIITIFMLVKMVASHAIKGVKGGGFSEKFWHKLVVALAVGFSPYYIVVFYSMPFFVSLSESIPWLPL